MRAKNGQRFRLLGMVAGLAVSLAVPALAATNPDVTAGAEAIKAGRHTDGISRLTQALQGGTLTPADAAEALYHRALGYAATGKNAQAGADFSHAIWLGALPVELLADAQQKRAAAFRAAGGTAPPAVQPATAAVTSAATRVASVDPQTTGTTSSPVAPRSAPVPVRKTREPLVAAPADVPQPAVAEAPAAVTAEDNGGFFSSIFGGGLVSSGGSSSPAASTSGDSFTGNDAFSRDR